VTSLSAQALLFTASADLGYRIFIVANEKFLSISVMSLRESDVSGQHIAKFGCRLENCHATTSLILSCSR